MANELGIFYLTLFVNSKYHLLLINLELIEFHTLRRSILYMIRRLCFSNIKALPVGVQTEFLEFHFKTNDHNCK